MDSKYWKSLARNVADLKTDTGLNWESNDTGGGHTCYELVDGTSLFILTDADCMAPTTAGGWSSVTLGCYDNVSDFDEPIFTVEGSRADIVEFFKNRTTRSVEPVETGAMEVATVYTACTNCEYATDFHGVVIDDIAHFPCLGCQRVFTLGAVGGWASFFSELEGE